MSRRNPCARARSRGEVTVTVSKLRASLVATKAVVRLPTFSPAITSPAPEARSKTRGLANGPRITASTSTMPTNGSLAPSGAVILSTSALSSKKVPLLNAPRLPVVNSSGAVCVSLPPAAMPTPRSMRISFPATRT